MLILEYAAVLSGCLWEVLLFWVIGLPVVHF
jgi:hypothetical protein